jgi:Iap family predicted aminopeptidase
MKSIFGALGTIVGAALAEMNKLDPEPTITVKEVEVYYTLIADGRSEMWTEEYKKLGKLIKDFKFFSKYKDKSIIKVIKKDSDEIIAVYQTDGSDKSVVTLMGDEAFADQLKFKIYR